MKKTFISLAIILTIGLTTQVSAQTYEPEWTPGPNYENFQPSQDFDNFQPGQDFDNFQPNAPQSWFDRLIDRLFGGAI